MFCVGRCERNDYFVPCLAEILFLFACFSSRFLNSLPLVLFLLLYPSRNGLDRRLSQMGNI
jgi:hypothetical protein